MCSEPGAPFIPTGCACFHSSCDGAIVFLIGAAANFSPSGERPRPPRVKVLIVPLSFRGVGLTGRRAFYVEEGIGEGV